MNGNITKDGITADLNWMKRVGIGGMQNFDAALATPQIVDKRLVYMSPEWKDAFHHAAELAQQLGLELAIASSPGWSETGGPWVVPKDAMKKLVWSEIEVTGGAAIKRPLPSPPSVPGPFQDMQSTPSMGENAPAFQPFYQDIAVVAVPIDATSAALPRPLRVTTNGETINADALLDTKSSTAIPLPKPMSGNPALIEYEYEKPQTVRSAVVLVTGSAPFGLGASVNPRLEVSDDGKAWRTVATFADAEVPSTASFEPVTSRRFRLLFPNPTGGATPGFFAIAPGVDPSAAASAFSGRSRPRELADFRLFGDARIHSFEQKAGFAIAKNYYTLDSGVGPDLLGVSPDSVMDLTSRMSSDGVLTWTPPAGRWKVLRLGYSLTGTTNHPATAEATGLEVDKYDASAVERYLKTYLGMYREVTGDQLMGARGLRAIVTDSIEVGPSNWTPGILDAFKRLRGYDARPWLPTLTGVIVGSRSQSDAFLYDYRRTLADLIASEHYGTVARVAHEQGLTVYGESLEATRNTLGDDLEMRRFADIPMAALWTYRKDKGPAPGYVADIRGAASDAHLYGRPFVAAESLTSILMPWAFAPSDLQPMIDVEFASGITRPVIHTSVHQPVDDKVPGLSLSVFGQYFNRHETWAEMAKPWVDYMARNSYLLQQGRNVADVAYFYGEDTPLGVLVSDHYFPDVPHRYAYDFVSPDALLSELSAQDGALVSKGGARYKVVYLGGTSAHMTLPILRRLAELAQSGATIVGAAPESSPSLKDDRTEFAKLTHRLWSGERVTTVGQGRVIAGTDVEAALAQIGVAPDFSYRAADPTPEVLFVHRRMDDGDIYFVDNRAQAAEHLETHFRVIGKQAEIWHADTGRTELVSYRIEGRETIVPLDMAAQESLFVIFRQSATTSSAVVAQHEVVSLGELSGPWDVSFQAGRGAPPKTRLPALVPLSDNSEPGIKYFSGLATYTKNFPLPKGVQPGAPLLLDLGRVGDVAEVRVNGKAAGFAWKSPYRVDIGALVHSGENALEVGVADLWVNRLIGDAQPGAQKITFTTLKTYLPSAPLRPSGLIGPVSLLEVKVRAEP
jgi:hypothetical protein